MKKEELKYEQLIDSLKKSKPEFRDEEVINDRIFRQILLKKEKPEIKDLIIEFFFGWVYVGWVRKSMIAAAILVISIFTYQQSLILKRLDQLPKQEIPATEFNMSSFKSEVETRILQYRLSDNDISEKQRLLTEKEIDNFIKSLKKIKHKNKELLEMVEKDPVLKEYLEMKMKEAE